MICQSVRESEMDELYHSGVLLEDQRRTCLDLCPGSEGENFKAMRSAI